MPNKKFIFTTNMESAALLLRAGFQLVNQSGEQWTFLNSDKLTFEHLDGVVYTNNLCI